MEKKVFDLSTQSVENFFEEFIIDPEQYEVINLNEKNLNEQFLLYIKSDCNSDMYLDWITSVCKKNKWQILITETVIKEIRTNLSYRVLIWIIGTLGKEKIIRLVFDLPDEARLVHCIIGEIGIETENLKNEYKFGEQTYILDEIESEIEKKLYEKYGYYKEGCALCGTVCRRTEMYDPKTGLELQVCKNGCL